MHTSMSPSGKYVPNGTEPNAETTMVFFFSFTPSPSNSFSKHSRINDSIFRNTIRRLFSDCFDGRSEAINSSVNASNNGEEEETPRARFFFFFFSSRVVVSVARNASFPLLVLSKSSFILVLLLLLLLPSRAFPPLCRLRRAHRRRPIGATKSYPKRFRRPRLLPLLLPSSRSSPLEPSVVVLVFEEQNAFARSTNDGNRRPNMFCDVRANARRSRRRREDDVSQIRRRRRRRLGKRISNLSLSLSLGAFSLTLSRVALSLVAVSRLRLYESCCAFYGIARGNAALLCISLLCVGVLLVVRSKGKYRKSRESVRLRKICASSRTPPSPPRTKDRFEEKDSREMRALLLCVAVHK